MSKLSRRQFIRLAGLAAGLAAPTTLGLAGLLRAAAGEEGRNLSPYARMETGAGSAPTDSSQLRCWALTHERSDNPFGAYLVEILRAEGLNFFETTRWTNLNDNDWEQSQLVILAEGALNAAQAERLKQYVAKGGNLIAMRPDARLSDLLGVERVAGNLTQGYLRVEPSQSVGRGVLSGASPFYGTADYFRLAGAQAIAWLATQPEAHTDFPAVTWQRFGQGRASLWAFDLARSIVLMRQGNPAWANQERDGRLGIRAVDAFVGWMELERIGIPHADEQMRLLSWLIAELLSDVSPLPRLWYFPDAAESMLIATGDSHQNTVSAIEAVLKRVEQRAGHISIYYTPPLGNVWQRAFRRARGWITDLPSLKHWQNSAEALPSAAHVTEWRTRGHEFALHPYIEEGLAASWERYWQTFTGLGYGTDWLTTRTHAIAWTGWVETARVQATYGLRMNLDFYHYGTAFRAQSGEWHYGYFNGSGLPMKFVDEEGRILNIYQQVTQLVDEHLMQMMWGGGWANLTAEAALEISRAVLQRSVTVAPSAIAAQFHVDPFAAGGEWATQAARWLEGTLDYAVEQHIPIWSAAQWLHFVELRQAARLTGIRWNSTAQQLSFGLQAPLRANMSLTIMLPIQHGTAQLRRVEVDGVNVPYRARTLGARFTREYGWLPAPAGSHQVAATYG